MSAFGEWGGPVRPPQMAGAAAGGVQDYVVATVNGDGTVDLRGRSTRDARQRVPGLAGWSPTVGDQVLVVDVGGDQQSPAIVAVQTAAIDPVAMVYGDVEDLADDAAALSAQVGTLATTVAALSLAPPHVAVRRAAAQSIAHNTFTAATELVWDTADNADATMWTTGKNITVPRNGVYIYSYGGSFENHGTTGGYRLVAPHINGNEIPGWRAQFNIGAAVADSEIGRSMTRRFTAGDLLTLRVYHTNPSNTALNWYGTAALTWLGP